MDVDEFTIINELIFDSDSIYVIEDLVNISQMICSGLINSFSLIPALRETHIRPDGYFENWLPQYIDTDFYRMFRMSRSTFQKLLQIVGPKSRIKLFHGGNKPIPFEKSLLVTLWFLAKGETLRSIGDRFNMCDSAVFNSTEEGIKIIAELCPSFIKWPTELECNKIEAEYRNIQGYPGVIGAIDGTHISCKVPEGQHVSYLNRKQQHSVVLQVICTADYLFTNIYAGFPGSAHDSRVLQNSTLYKDIERFGPNKYFYGKYHLLGDSAYFLREWLITPYIDYGRLSAAEKKHNYIHSATRVKIENSIGKLKGRWQVLKFINVYEVKKVVLITTASCVLHNFTYGLNDVWMEEEVEDNSDNEEFRDEHNRRGQIEGQVKRNDIKNLLCA